TLSLPAAHTDAASETLAELGAIAVTLQDAAGEIVIETQWDQTPMWSKVSIMALLPAETDPESVCQHLAAQLGLADAPGYQAARIDDQDWAQAWKRHYKPIHMGGRLWICPSWCEPPDAGAVNVVLDPGMA